MDTHVSRADVGEIETVSFGIAGDVENERDATVVVSSVETIGADRRPIGGGLYDAYMGSGTNDYYCRTCGQRRGLCPGHIGLVELKFPLLAPLFVAQVFSWLRLVCWTCGEPAVKIAPGDRLQAVASRANDLAKKKVPTPCGVCGAPKRLVRRAETDHYSMFEVNGAASATLEGAERGLGSASRGSGAPTEMDARSPDRRIPNAEIEAILQRVPPAAVAALGLPPTSHPSRLVGRTAAVPPPTVRPMVEMAGGGSRSQSDLQSAVRGFVLYNSKVPDPVAAVLGATPAPGARPAYSYGPKEGGFHELKLQILKEGFIMGGGAAAARGGGRRGGPKKLQMTNSRALLALLKSKEGLVRRRLLSRTAVMVGRATISNNPRLEVDQVGIPLYFARTLYVEMRVTAANYEEAMGFFLNGTDRYPGCSRVFRRARGREYHRGALERLELGDVIYRDVVDDDLILISRSPALERSSKQVMRAQIVRSDLQVGADANNATIELNAASCDWYGADFDGDEMNVGTLATPAAQAEGHLISSASSNLVSTKNGATVPGQLQDSVDGAFHLCRAPALSKRAAMRVLAPALRGLPEVPDLGLLPPAGPAVRGAAVVTATLGGAQIDYDRPSAWNRDGIYAKYTDAFRARDARFRVAAGRVVGAGPHAGVGLDKKAIGGGSRGGVADLIAKRYGPGPSLKFIFALQQVAIAFLGGVRGFTVSPNDMVLGPAARAAVAREVGGVLARARELTRRLKRQELSPPIGMRAREFYEAQIVHLLSLPSSIWGPALAGAGSAGSHASPPVDLEWNGLLQMIFTGAKGKPQNYRNIALAIGAVVINDERVRPLLGAGRTSPFHPRFDVRPEAYGFIPGNYITGVKPAAYLFDDMKSRFDLVTKALFTSVTGQSNRESAVALQGLVIDSFLRVAAMGRRRIVQLLYGGDGIDARRTVRAVYRPCKPGAAGAPTPTAAELAAGAARRTASDAELTAWALGDYGGPNAAAAAAAVLADRRAIAVSIAQRLDHGFAEAVGLSGREGRLDLAFDPAALAEAAIAATATKTAALAKGEKVAAAAEVERKLAAVAAWRQALVSAFGSFAPGAAPPEIVAGVFALGAAVSAAFRPAAVAGMSRSAVAAAARAGMLLLHRALIEPGAAVGLLAAQAVSEPLTQYMLDSHHRSIEGGTSKSTGERPGEIFGVKKTEDEAVPEMLLRLAPEFENDRAAAEAVAAGVVRDRLAMFVTTVWPLFDKLGDLRASGAPDARAADRAWLADFVATHPLTPPPADLVPGCIRLRIDPVTLAEKQMSLERLVERVRTTNAGKVWVAHSPETSPEIIVRVWLRRGALPARDADLLATCRALADPAGWLLATPLLGVAGVTDARVVEVPKLEPVPAAPGAVAHRTVFAVRTAGTNLSEAFRVNGVDPARCVSSSIRDSVKAFGHMAASSTIVRETWRLMGSRAPDPRHIGIYAAQMTSTDRVTAIKRPGVVARNEDPFLQIAAGKPNSALIKAALRGTKAPVDTFSASLCIGKPPPYGTYFTRVSVDPEFIAEHRTDVAAAVDALGDL